jgi:stage V sporulation protein AF
MGANKSLRPEPGTVLSRKLEENVELMNEALGVKKSFDVICRRLQYGGKDFALYFVDGFAKDDVMLQILKHLANLEQGKITINTLKKLLETHISYLEVETQKDVNTLLTAVLSGPLVLVVDGEEEAIVIDARTYPARGPEEPDIERVVRGSRDGFVETLIFNTALTRRRVRDPGLRMEYLQIGARSKTDLCLAYIEDIADPKLVQEMRERIKGIEIDGLPMAEKTVEEYLFKQHWNPFPLVRYTERPDVAAVHLLEGHVLLYCDTSPSVMITPTTLFHHVQHAEEYRQKPIIGAYLRWVRFAAIFASVFLLPLWFMFASDPTMLPKEWRFIGPEDKSHLSLIWQVALAEIGVDVLRMAAIHTPNPLGTALGLVAAIVLGQVAVDVGLFTKEVVLYIAIAAIGNFATPSYEFSLANRLVRLFLLFAVFLFGLTGFLVATGLIFLMLLTTRSVIVPYLWPLLPLNIKALWHIIVRSPVPARIPRPKQVAQGDRQRQ